jgi:hypothetical protein
VPGIHAHLNARSKQYGADQIDIGGMMIGKKELATALAFGFSKSLQVNHDTINSGKLRASGEKGLVRN